MSRPKWIKKAPWVLRFKGRKRKKPTTQIVLHESVSRRSAIKYLKRKNLSVNYEVMPDGTVTEHCSPSRRTAHAGGAHNAISIGVEIVSPYYGSRAREGEEVIPARWAHKKKYIVPPLVQCEAVWKLVAYLCTTEDIPFNWPGVTEDYKSFRWGRIKNDMDPGCTAHARWAHSDGLFFEYFCLLRYGGLAKNLAYEQAIKDASSGKRVTPLPIALYCADWDQLSDSYEFDDSDLAQ